MKLLCDGEGCGGGGRGVFGGCSNGSFNEGGEFGIIGIVREVIFISDVKVGDDLVF